MGECARELDFRWCNAVVEHGSGWHRVVLAVITRGEGLSQGGGKGRGLGL
jgi:hypothetical protein